MTDHVKGKPLTDAEALAAYDDIAREFIAKVDRGEARSRRTYALLKTVLERRSVAVEGGPV